MIDIGIGNTAKGEHLAFTNEADFKANFGKVDWLRAYQQAEMDRNTQHSQASPTTGLLTACPVEKAEHETMKLLIEKTKLIQKEETVSAFPATSDECAHHTRTNACATPLLAHLQKMATQANQPYI